jgi:CheY-like chemotaxis protein
MEMTNTVIAVVDDLFFAAKIRGTAESLGVSVSFPRRLEALVELARQKRPGLIICDLHSEKIDPLQVAKEIKHSEELRQVQLIGFFSHVHTELQRAAEQAGFDQVMPRSAFNTHLREILAGAANETK